MLLVPRSIEPNTDQLIAQRAPVTQAGMTIDHLRNSGSHHLKQTMVKVLVRHIQHQGMLA